MARHLDLEEQEQLDQLKHFWNRYGNLITWVLIAVFGTIAGWNGWQYWERTRSAQASALFELVERAADAGDVARVERAFGDIRERFGGTVYAQQAGLLAAKVLTDASRSDAARDILAWVARDGSDDGHRATARLRLAGVLADAKAYDDALVALDASFPEAFAPLVADRRGDILQLQGKHAEAKAQYTRAWELLDERAEYRRLIEVKLTALGVDVRTLKPAATGVSIS